MSEEIEYYDEYEPPIIKRRASAITGTPTIVSVKQPVKRPASLVTPFGIGMCIVILLLILWTMVIVPWWHGLQVQWHYGDNRVCVFGADVGHGGVSRFISFEDGTEIIVVEYVAKKYTVYTIAVTAQPNQLITLSVADVNGDGKPDLLVHVEGTDGSFALLNNGSAFSWNPER